MFATPLKKALLFAAMLIMLWCGYQLANFENTHLYDTIDDLSNTVDNLNVEHHELTRRVNQLLAEKTVCANELVFTKDAVTEQTNLVQSCQEKVSFYEHVMAPELSQRLLSVDLIAVNEVADSQREYVLDIVLLQPRTQKDLISGKLNVALLATGSQSVIYLLELDYQFKFFQQFSQTITLPADVQPEALLFKSDVVQFGRVREQLEQRIPWPVKQ